MELKKGDTVKRKGIKDTSIDAGLLEVLKVEEYMGHTYVHYKRKGGFNLYHNCYPEDLILISRGGKNMEKKLKDKFVLVSDNESELETDCIFDTKKEVMEWVEENERDPILCKIVPISKISFKSVEEKL